MGYIRDHTIVISSYGEKIKLAHEKAEKIFPNIQVSPILKGMINGCESFYIAPDGSKEGWEESNEGDERRKKFVSYLVKNDVPFVELYFNDDQGEAKILNHS